MTRHIVQEQKGPSGYDRDYVKTLEREIEVNGDNRFKGFPTAGGEADTTPPEHPQPGRGRVQDRDVK